MKELTKKELMELDFTHNLIITSSSSVVKKFSKSLNYFVNVTEPNLSRYVVIQGSKTVLETANYEKAVDKYLSI